MAYPHVHEPHAVLEGPAEALLLGVDQWNIDVSLQVEVVTLIRPRGNQSSIVNKVSMFTRTLSFGVKITK